MDKTIENGAPATNEGQEQELEINLDTTDGGAVDSNEEMVPKKQFNQVFARTKKLEEENRKLKASINPQDTQVKPSVTVDNKGFDLDEVTDLRLDGYSKDEVKFIMNNGGRKALEDNTFVKVAIEQIRTQKKAEAAIPDMDSGKSDIERKYTQEQLSKMSAEELYKILPKANN